MDVTIKVLTPAKTILETVGSKVFIPGPTGNFEIQKNHARLMSEVPIGLLRIEQNGKLILLIVYGGFGLVESNMVLLLINGSEPVTNMTAIEAQLKLDEAKLVFYNAKTLKERLKANTEIQKAAARLEATQYYDYSAKT